MKAAHAASVEPLNEETIFYLETRGIETNTARELLIKGYFEQILDLFGIEVFSDISRAHLNTKWKRDD